MNNIFRGAIASIAIMSTAVTACAQNSRVPSEHCDPAIATITRGGSSRDVGTAYGRLRTCGERGALAMASRIPMLRSSNDRFELVAASNAATLVRDSRIFEAWTRLAAERTATPIARISAVRALILLIRPNLTIDLRQLAGPEVDCTGSGLSSDSRQIVVSELPGDHKSRLLALSLAIGNDESSPTELRRAASCLHLYAKTKHK